MEDKVELMYRQPDREDHQNLTEVLDEMVLLLKEIDERVNVLENYIDSLETTIQELNY